MERQKVAVPGGRKGQSTRRREQAIAESSFRKPIVPFGFGGLRIDRFNATPFLVAGRYEAPAPIGFAQLELLILFEIDVAGFCVGKDKPAGRGIIRRGLPVSGAHQTGVDRKSTRLNSS